MTDVARPGGDLGSQGAMAPAVELAAGPAVELAAGPAAELAVGSAVESAASEARVEPAGGWAVDEAGVGPAAGCAADAALLERISAELGRVDDALRRLDGGTYGTCAVCATPLAPERLEADPLLARCDAHPG